ncbi:50S ribosomal protein L33 [Candidatus Roizmanbacteria bacterium CG_4_10_14_0_8_um_filter_33_9]|uniref:Large ribosomal subunit protein bL33 n=1 Tax=Candidatus Roizmanbacteria bacterium CG_4_10_14_0_8_um_filter_33_9 TaxID=1974826 RepID=A0A2M7QIG5_9BACT|nr:MAG: 50S ribosomal protein L33 [Candidatus Roizmanbacteria bacterium CG_4_10_14_0_8_um_filter_33_9]
MAKKGSRMLVGLVCSVCSKQNYIVEKNKVNTPTALKLKKYCNKCKKNTDHKERKKLD